MDLSFVPFPPLILFLLFVFTLIKTTKSKKPTIKLPPCPWKLPIIGHIHHLAMRGGCPHHTLRDLATKHGPVMHLKLGEVDHIVISSPEAAKEVMSTHDLNFASRPRLLFSTIMVYGNADIAFAPYGSYWRQIRKICVLELLSGSRVRSFRPIMDEATANLVRDISASSRASMPFNLSNGVLKLANVIISRAAFGMECQDGQRFMSKTREATDMASGFSVSDVFPSLGFMATLAGERRRLERVHRDLDEILTGIIDEHRLNSSQDGDRDLVDVLLRIKETDGFEIPLTMANIKAVVTEMFFAGTETTSSTMEWAMAELMRHPEAMEKAQSEVRRAAGAKGKVEEGDMEGLRYMKHVINETLRLHPPAPLLLPRVCEETREVGGFSIPAGSRVLVNVWAIARDGRYWLEPESFKPERFEGSSVDFRGGSFEFLPFGGGRRICPGIGFGLTSMELAMATLLLHFDWELPGGMRAEELDMTEVFRTTVGRKTELHLIATLRVPLPD